MVSALAGLALVAAPVAAQAAAQPAARTGAPVEAQEGLSTTGWVLAGIGLALLIWGIIELTNDDEPDSP
jgi:protein-S-isoprenylcysteine O-methyltransferase Ste14